MPESYIEIKKSGICTACDEYLSNAKNTVPAAQKKDHDQLNELLRTCQGRGAGGYDALVLLSGGKDSAYLLHSLASVYPELRILTVLVDNGFMSPIALENASCLRRKFNFDHITLSPRRSFVKTVFHYALTHLERQKGYSIVDLLDGTITFDSARNLAAKCGIPLVIGGVGRVQAENLFGITSFELTREQELAALKKHADIVLEEVTEDEDFHLWWDPLKWPSASRPRTIFPFMVWDPDETYILKEVERLGLIDKKRCSPLLTNNALIPVIGLAENARLGYTSFEVEFARMIREGKSKRKYWLNLFEMLEVSAKTGKFINKSVTQTLSALGLSKADIGIN